jgi:hypothetical protein
MRLKELSHSEAAIAEVRSFCNRLSGTRERMEVWNATNAVVCAPIEMSHVQELGYNKQEDEFVLLQGDIVRTDSAYIFGERINGHPK